MTSRKNNFSPSDHRYMKLAINLAKVNLDLTGLNPSVGCVIVKNDEIISYGQTGLKVRPHTEYSTIKNCKKNLKDSTMYVSMEPCTHYWKTPPCTYLIVKSKIKKLFYAIDDLDVRTSKKSFSLLKSNNVIIKKNLLNNVKTYFQKINYPIDYNELVKLNIDQLISTVCMISPFSVGEKQKLIETIKIEDKIKVLVEIIKFNIFTNFQAKTIQ